MPGSAASAMMQGLRDQLDELVEQLSRLADSKRIYGNMQTVHPGTRPAGPAQAQVQQPDAGAFASLGAVSSPIIGSTPTVVAAPALTSTAAQRNEELQRPEGGGNGTQGGGGGGGGAASGRASGSRVVVPAPEASSGVDLDVESLLRRADDCSCRMLSLLADEPPHAAAALQPLRGAALLAAALCTYLRGGGADEGAVRGLQAAVKLRPLSPCSWNCLAHCYWERGDLFMAGCCLASGLRHCPSTAGHQMMSLLVRQQGGAAGAALLQQLPPQPLPLPHQHQPHTSPNTGSNSLSNTNTTTTTHRRGPTPTGEMATAAAAAAACGSSTPSPPPPPASASSSLSASAPSSPSAFPAFPLSAALTASLIHARRALELDLENGYSWYVLAMAQMAVFFRGEHQSPQPGGGGEGGTGRLEAGGGSCDGRGGGGCGGRGELHRVLAAFAQAERCGGSDLPDLYYNRAALHAFAQDFGAALQDYARAALLDPGLPAPAQLEALRGLMGQLAGLVAERGGVREERRWAAVAAVLARDAARAPELLRISCPGERLALRSLRELQPGSNRGLAVMGRALAFVSPPLNASGTVYLVCVDTGGCVFVLSLTRLHHHHLDLTQLLIIAHPEMRQVDVTWPQPQPSPSAQPPKVQPKPQPSTAAAVAAPAALPSPLAATTSEINPAAAAVVPYMPRTYRFPLLTVGCDPGCRTVVLVDGVPLHTGAPPQLPTGGRHVVRAA